MSIKGQAYIAGAYEHPTRKAPESSLAQLHAEVALGALADAGLSIRDVEGYFCAGDAPGMGPMSMVDYLNLKFGTSTRPISGAAPTSSMSRMRRRRSPPANATSRW